MSRQLLVLVLAATAAVASCADATGPSSERDETEVQAGPERALNMLRWEKREQARLFVAHPSEWVEAGGPRALRSAAEEDAGDFTVSFWAVKESIPKLVETGAASVSGDSM